MSDTLGFSMPNKRCFEYYLFYYPTKQIFFLYNQQNFEILILAGQLHEMRHLSRVKEKTLTITRTINKVRCIIDTKAVELHSIKANPSV